MKNVGWCFRGGGGGGGGGRGNHWYNEGVQYIGLYSVLLGDTISKIPSVPLGCSVLLGMQSVLGRDTISTVGMFNTVG